MKVAPQQAKNNSRRTATDTAQTSRQNPTAKFTDQRQQTVVQRALIEGINESPRMLAQRQQIEGYKSVDQNPKHVQTLSTPQITGQQPVRSNHSLPIIQAKLTIGQPNDKYEQEADRVAAHVVEQITATNSPMSKQARAIQRQAEPEQKLQKKPGNLTFQQPALTSTKQLETISETRKLLMKSSLQQVEAIEGDLVSSNLQSAIDNAKGGGQPLDKDLQQSMGKAMDASFSEVRIHTDAQSDQLNRSIQAKAFTTGQDVFFRQGMYQPSSRSGQELIAHELTHVAQQNGRQLQRLQLLPSANIAIQRAIDIHRVNDGDNQNPSNRRKWFKSLVSSELLQIMGHTQEPNHNKGLIELLGELETKNVNAWNIAMYEIAQFSAANKFKDKVVAADILEINELLNRFKIAMKQESVAPEVIKNVLIGNEFTFTNPSLKGIKANDKDDLAEKMKIPYNKIVTDWYERMARNGIRPYQDYPTDNKRKLYYKFTKEDHGADWGYQVTPDQYCVEIITDPAEAKDIYNGHLANLMDAYIFRVASETGLSADPLIGGGHINIDEKTAFGNDPKKAAKVLAGFITEFYKDSKYWEGLDKDTKNAAFPKDLPYANDKKLTKQLDFELLISRFNKGDWSVTKLADELMANVFDDNLVEANKKESPHYQALNVEHLGTTKGTGSEVNEKARRLEVRRVPAQPNRKALIEQLNRIASLLEVAKGEAKKGKEES